MVMSVQVLSMMLGVAICCGACHYPAGTLSAAAVKESASIQIQAPHIATYARQLAQGGRYSISGTAWLQDKQGKRVTDIAMPREVRGFNSFTHLCIIV